MTTRPTQPCCRDNSTFFVTTQLCCRDYVTVSSRQRDPVVVTTRHCAHVYTQAVDVDVNETYRRVFYEIIAVDPPYLVDRETGVVTTADVFTERSGEVDRYTVVAYDNEGREPSFTSTAVLTVRL